MNKQEKVVLNEEEAKWLEHLKSIANFTHCLYVVTRQGWNYDFEFYVHEEKYKLSYRDDNDEESEQTKYRLVNALIYGYEVEKEKLYTVEIPNPNECNGANIVLVKKESGICVDCYYNNFYKKLDRARLTEAEIKKDFDWAWEFAEEVKE